MMTGILVLEMNHVMGMASVSELTNVMEFSVPKLQTTAKLHHRVFWAHVPNMKMRMMANPVMMAMSQPQMEGMLLEF